MRARWLFVLFVVALGCAPDGKIVEADMARAQVRVRTALGQGARKESQASIFLALAESEMARARESFARGDLDEARLWSLRAEVDAALSSRLAIGRTLSEEARTSYERASALMEKLK